jgi:hypothetical protein
MTFVRLLNNSSKNAFDNWLMTVVTIFHRDLRRKLVVATTQGRLGGAALVGAMVEW